MKNLFLIETYKPSRLYLEDGTFKLTEYDYPNMYYAQNQHIHITNSEEIKEGDRHLVWLRGKWEVLNYMPSIGYRKECLGKEVCKIILTTDKDLIKDGVQAIDDEFLEWFVKNPSCESVQVENTCLEERQCMCESNENCLKDGYKIIIPQEEPKQKKDLAYWKENAEEDYMKVPISVLRYITELEERMYSEQDMLKFAWFLIENVGQYSCDRTAHFEGKYLEQFKKKA